MTLAAIEALPLILVIMATMVMTLVPVVHVVESRSFHQILKKTVGVLMVKVSKMELELGAAEMKVIWAEMAVTVVAIETKFLEESFVVVVVVAVGG